MEIDLNDTPEEKKERDQKERTRAERYRTIGSVPGIFVDTWHLVSFKGHIRVTFGEVLGNIDNFRSAIVLDLDDAEVFARQLHRMARQRKVRDEEIAAAKAAGEPAEEEDTGDEE